MMTQQYQSLGSTSTSKISPNVRNPIHSSKAQEHYSGTPTHLPCSELVDLAHSTIISITIQYPPCQHYLDFILYPSSAELSLDSQPASNKSTSQSDNARCAWNNTSSRQNSKRNLERYTQNEESFEKVALGLETQRTSRPVLDRKMLEILDSL